MWFTYGSHAVSHSLPPAAPLRYYYPHGQRGRHHTTLSGHASDYPAARFTSRNCSVVCLVWANLVMAVWFFSHRVQHLPLIIPSPLKEHSVRPIPGLRSGPPWTALQWPSPPPTVWCWLCFSSSLQIVVTHEDEQLLVLVSSSGPLPLIWHKDVWMNKWFRWKKNDLWFIYLLMCLTQNQTACPYLSPSYTSADFYWSLVRNPAENCFFYPCEPVAVCNKKAVCVCVCL